MGSYYGGMGDVRESLMDRGSRDVGESRWFERASVGRAAKALLMVVAATATMATARKHATGTDVGYASTADEWAKNREVLLSAGGNIIGPTGVEFLRVPDRVGLTGHALPQTAPIPTEPGRFPTVNFELHTACVTNRTKGIKNHFFPPDHKIIGAAIVHHNYGTQDFFDWDSAIHMNRVDGGDEPDYFKVTTKHLNFEWGFVLISENGRKFYEVGMNEEFAVAKGLSPAPLALASDAGQNTGCVVKHG